METPNLLQNDLQIDARVSGHLKEAAGWARFLGIIGILFSILIIIGAFLLPGYLIARMGYNPFGGSYDSSRALGILTTMITSVYLIAGLILFFAALFTLRFGSKTRDAIATNDQMTLDKGLMNLKFLFRLNGIIMVIYLGLLILAIVLGALGAMMR